MYAYANDTPYSLRSVGSVLCEGYRDGGGILIMMFFRGLVKYLYNQPSYQGITTEPSKDPIKTNNYRLIYKQPIPIIKDHLTPLKHTIK